MLGRVWHWHHSSTFGQIRAALLSYSARLWLHGRMKRAPDLVEIDFGILAFILAISMAYPAVRWLFAMLASR